MSKQSLIEKAGKIMDVTEVCQVASVDENGYPRICILVPLKHCGVSEIWFSTGTYSRKVAHFLKNDKAGVTFFCGVDSVTLTGRMSVVSDRAVKDALWSPWMEKHFPNGGKNDPEYCVLRFVSEAGTFYIDEDFESFSL